MKKLLASAAAFALIISSSVAVVPTVANADPVGKDIAEYCKAVNDAFPEVSVGECVSLFHTKGVVQYCKYLKLIGFLDAAGVNMGTCVSTLNKL